MISSIYVYTMELLVFWFDRGNHQIMSRQSGAQNIILSAQENINKSNNRFRHVLSIPVLNQICQVLMRYFLFSDFKIARNGACWRWMGYVIALFGQARSMPMPCSASNICCCAYHNAYESSDQRHWIAQGSSLLRTVSVRRAQCSLSTYSTMQFRFQIGPNKLPAAKQRNELKLSIIDPLVIKWIVYFFKPIWATHFVHSFFPISFLLQCLLLIFIRSWCSITRCFWCQSQFAHCNCIARNNIVAD